MRGTKLGIWLWIMVAKKLWNSFVAQAILKKSDSAKKFRILTKDLVERGRQSRQPCRSTTPRSSSPQNADCRRRQRRREGAPEKKKPQARPTMPSEESKTPSARLRSQSCNFEHLRWIAAHPQNADRHHHRTEQRHPSLPLGPGPERKLREPKGRCQKSGRYSPSSGHACNPRAVNGGIARSDGR
jgi:hypothetical protein